MNRQHNWVVANSEIRSENYIIADSEIDSVNCLASKTVSLLIWKLAAKSYVAAYLEINRDGGVIYGFTLTFFLGVYTFPHGIIVYFTN